MLWICCEFVAQLVVQQIEVMEFELYAAENSTTDVVINCNLHKVTSKIITNEHCAVCNNNSSKVLIVKEEGCNRFTTKVRKLIVLAIVKADLDRNRYTYTVFHN